MPLSDWIIYGTVWRASARRRDHRPRRAPAARTKCVMTETPRREFLKLALGGAFAAAAIALQRGRRGRAAGPADALRRRQRARHGARTRQVAVQAAERGAARRSSPVSPPSNISAIHRNPEHRRSGATSKTGFALEPLHRGFVFTTPVQINIVENGQAQRLIYDRSAFDFGKLQPPVDLPDLGFSGVRMLRAGDDQGWRDARDLPGRDLLPQPRARPDLRRERARPVDPHRRRAGRGVPAVPRAVDRKAEPGRRHADRSTRCSIRRA